MSKKLKVLLSAYACEPNRGSEPGIGWNWALEISKRGHDVVVLTRANNQKEIELFMNANNLNLKFLYYDLPKWFLKLKKYIGVNLYYSLWQIGVFFHVKRYLLGEKVDLIHHISFGVFRQVCYLSFLNVPFVFGPVGGGERAPYRLRKKYSYKDWIKDFLRDILNSVVYYSPVYRLMLSKSELIFVKTKETLKCIPKKYRYKSKIQLEIGVNEVCELEVNTEIDKFKILCVSRFVSLKAIHIILYVLDRLNNKYNNLELTIIGSGPLEKKLKSLQNDLKLENVTWVSWIEQSALKKFYKESSVFLFPSLHDSSGNVVLESLANSLPVICLDLGGPEVIVGPSDLIVKTKDRSESEIIEAIVNKIEFLITNPQNLIELKIKANERAKYFYWNDVVNRIYSLIESKN
tara:strand:- start:442 stop:1656 length:1215 start_codon:yes stop_codon:yes gene_type:complete